ncbi:MAG: peptide-methionine (S)-S-oxide reductase MsrA [Planctomycetota bacterium]
MIEQFLNSLRAGLGDAGKPTMWTAADPAEVASAREVAQAVLAGGCFWCTEAAFEQLTGVLDVTSGYAGGSRETAQYELVCKGRTGHAEVIRVSYDPSRLSFRQLLDVFFIAHDPTQLNRQGYDQGTQYRSAIFYANDEQLQVARQAIADWNASGNYSAPIVTTLEPLVEFFPAEPYHQDYARQHPDQPYIAGTSLPKVCKVQAKFPQLIRQPSSP